MKYKIFIDETYQPSFTITPIYFDESFTTVPTAIHPPFILLNRHSSPIVCVHHKAHAYSNQDSVVV